MKAASVHLIPGWSIGGSLPFTLPRELSAEVSTQRIPLSDDEKWMFISLLEGMKACGLSNPNPSVGCTIVTQDRQVSTGATEAFKLRHAERVALSSVSEHIHLSKCTAYLTLEPCAHQGYQPPCADFLIEKGIGRVVIATRDPNPKVGGKGIEKLLHHSIPVSVGILGREARLWHLPFLGFQLLGRPLFIGKWAETKNGLLAKDTGAPMAITGKASRAYVHWLRQKYDAILVGAGTVLKDHPQLTVRDSRLPILRQPLRIVVDLRGRISEISPLLLQTTFAETAKTVLIIKEGYPYPKGLPQSVPVIAVSEANPVFAIKNWIASEKASQIFGKPIQSVFVEGGPTLHQLFFEAGGYDLLHVFTSESRADGSRYFIPFEKYGHGLTLVTQNILQQDTLREYVSSLLWERVNQQ